MKVFKRGSIYWFELVFKGQRIQRSTTGVDGKHDVVRITCFRHLVSNLRHRLNGCVIFMHRIFAAQLFPKKATGLVTWINSFFCGRADERIENQNI